MNPPVGANPTIQGRWNDTALQIAEEYGNKEIIALLRHHIPAVNTIIHDMAKIVIDPKSYTTPTAPTKQVLTAHNGH